MPPTGSSAVPSLWRTDGATRVLLYQLGKGVAMVTPTKKRGKWLVIHVAAEMLSLSTDALRKRLERNAFSARDGVTEAEFDGVRGRKLGGNWRVALSPRWTE